MDNIENLPKKRGRKPGSKLKKKVKAGPAMGALIYVKNGEVYVPDFDHCDSEAKILTEVELIFFGDPEIEEVYLMKAIRRYKKPEMKIEEI
jgi:hypothetical protein